jgi:DNA-binding IclR family transcriptional regulator
MNGNPQGKRAPFVGRRQAAALRYIARRKTPPTRSEIGRHLGITRVSAHLLVDKLVSAQLLARDGLGWRNLRVTESGRTMVGTA